MELKDVERLMDKFETSSIREMQVDANGGHLFLSKNTNAAALNKQEAANPEKTAEAVAEKVQEKAVEDGTEQKNEVAGTAIKSPLVGTVYLQSKPGAAPYVKVGDRVENGQVVCIVEAMKMLTEIKSNVAGTVSQVCVENGDLIECDQELFLVKED